jgi:hypothetical protein
MHFFPKSASIFRWLVPALGFLVATVSGQAQEDIRFSSTLSAAQQAETGLDRLSTDNVAVIDALVRQDIAATRVRDNTIRTTRFSQRRTDHERDIAGLDHLTADQLAKLDAFVALRMPAPVLAPDASLAYASVSLDTNAPRVTVERPGPEIHGSFSLTYGWSKAGSIRGGESVITYVDPARGFSLTMGYSQYRGTGLAPYPYSGAYGPYAPSLITPGPIVAPEDH